MQRLIYSFSIHSFLYVTLQLLPKLHDIANKSQNPGGPVENKIKQISEELKVVLEQQMKVCLGFFLSYITKTCMPMQYSKIFFKCKKSPRTLVENKIKQILDELRVVLEQQMKVRIDFSSRKNHYKNLLRNFFSELKI